MKISGQYKDYQRLQLDEIRIDRFVRVDGEDSHTEIYLIGVDKEGNEQHVILDDAELRYIVKTVNKPIVRKD